MAFPLQFLLETVVPQLLMGNTKKKKHSKKDKASENVLDLAALTLKKFRKVGKQLAKLSTGQKLVGGLALTAAGLVYLAARDADEAPATPEPAEPKEPAVASEPSRKSRKTPKHRSETE